MWKLLKGPSLSVILHLGHVLPTTTPVVLMRQSLAPLLFLVYFSSSFMLAMEEVHVASGRPPISMVPCAEE